MTPRLYGMVSSPTSGALVMDSVHICKYFDDYIMIIKKMKLDLCTLEVVTNPRNGYNMTGGNTHF